MPFTLIILLYISIADLLLTACFVLINSNGAIIDTEIILANPPDIPGANLVQELELLFVIIVFQITFTINCRHQRYLNLDSESKM